VTIAIDATATSGEASEGDKIATDVENAKGGAGADTITGSSSNNVLYGGAGADTVSGGAGDDTFMNLCTTTDGDDTFSGGAGSDTFDYSSCVATNGALLAALSADGTSNGTGGLKDKDKNGTADDQEADVYYPDVENLTGGDGADSLTGSVYYSTSVTGANIIDGGAGNDTIDGLSGDDLIDGGAGTDVVDCGTGEGDSVMNAESTFMCEI
jgi:Ca2+-binding RTX toxin-like protein